MQEHRLTLNQLDNAISMFAKPSKLISFNLTNPMGIKFLVDNSTKSWQQTVKAAPKMAQGFDPKNATAVTVQPCDVDVILGPRSRYSSCDNGRGRR